MSDEATVVGGPQPGAGGVADIDEKVFAEAVRRGLITPSQGTAALEEARARSVALLEVLRGRNLVTEEAARDLDEETKEDFVPGYRVLSKLGEGGMGVVYRALQKRLDREVALKVVMPRLAADPAYLKRFEREAKAVGRLNHPNIVAAYDYGESNGRVFLAMEFVDGVNGADWIRKNGPMGEDRALAVVRDVAAGLAHAHAAGIIHRDIKPGNILLAARKPGDTASSTASGAKVMDLGLARAANASGGTELTAAGAILGTPGFMAPEQAFGREVDHRADIYALGATLYQFVTGRRPFDATTPVAVIARQQTDRLEDPRTAAPCSTALCALLQGMLSRDPATRYPGYRELIADLDRVKRGEAPLHPLPPEAHRSVAETSADPGTLEMPRGSAPSAPATAAAAVSPRSQAPAATEIVPPAAAPPARGPQGSPSRRPIVVGVLVAGLAAFGGFLALRPGASGTGDGKGGASPSAPPAAPPTAAPAEDPADPLPAAAENAVAKDLAEGKEREALQKLLAAKRKWEATPPAQRPKMSPRLQRNLLLAREGIEGRIERHLKDGEPAKAGELLRWVQGELGAEGGPRLEALAARVGEAERPPAETEPLRAARAARERDDPEAMIAALAGYPTRFPESPLAREATRLLQWAEAEAPLVEAESDPPGALLVADGKEIGTTPCSFRSRAGKQVAAAYSKEGYEPLKTEHWITRESRNRFSVSLKALAAKDPAPAVLLVRDGDPRPLWTGASLGGWSPWAGEWTVSDPSGKATLEGEEGPEPAALLRGKSPASLGAARMDMERFVRGAPGWRLEWQMVGEARRTGTALVEFHFAVRPSGTALVLGIDDQDVFLGTRDPATKELVRTHRLKGVAANHRHTFVVECHGDVFTATVDGRPVGAVAVPADMVAERTIRAAVEGGRGFFSDIQVQRLRKP